MEKRMKDLFEYQKFENNSRLAKLISETESRYASELSDDDLFFVNAAGEFDISGKKNEEDAVFPEEGASKTTRNR